MSFSTFGLIRRSVIRCLVFFNLLSFGVRSFGVQSGVKQDVIPITSDQVPHPAPPAEGYVPGRGVGSGEGLLLDHVHRSRYLQRSRAGGHGPT